MVEKITIKTNLPTKSMSELELEAKYYRHKLFLTELEIERQRKPD